jgi:hypothetical protein
MLCNISNKGTPNFLAARKFAIHSIPSDANETAETSETSGVKKSKFWWF